MTVENIMKYCEIARARGVSQMGITEHDRYLEEIDLAAFQEARELSRDVDLRLGIEIDYVPGAEERMDDEATDQRIYDRYETYDLYTAYYANVRKAVLSGRFEILGHPDLIKIFRHVPDRDITPILEETADAVAESGVVIDVNTAGLRKPIGEIYPARDFLEMFHKRGVPIVLSSDAHAPDQVAMGYDTSLALVHEVGYREVATFRNHERGALPL